MEWHIEVWAMRCWQGAGEKQRGVLLSRLMSSSLYSVRLNELFRILELEVMRDRGNEDVER